ncbi:hypothetical protein HO173_001996 [Letharia columbiana]|uniref:Uncharacterized protein n=1 Tax=Letharia columbiana TaxID=112416 RepID=A0A8H6G4S8_9LECA|nr:uncharacterized protein HO173_001996 [Letharia columbiana]KAF6240385.1 hypothetical protein HO173_001996 [Letharia columbiana]
MLALASSIKPVAPSHYRKDILLATSASNFARKWSMDHRLTTPGILAVILSHCILTRKALSDEAAAFNIR